MKALILGLLVLLFQDPTTSQQARELYRRASATETETPECQTRTTSTNQGFVWQSEFGLFNAASNQNYISPGCDVVVKGREFGDVTASSGGVALYELAGCSVTIGNERALIRGVRPDAIYLLAPDNYQERVSDFRDQWIISSGIVFQGRWEDVAVTTPKGVFRTKVAVSRVSPGLYHENGVASGLTRIGQGPVLVLRDHGAFVGSRVSLLATGFRRAHKVFVYFADTDISVEAEVFSWGPSFPWLESVAFDVPAGLKGRVFAIVENDGQFSNSVEFVVRE